MTDRDTKPASWRVIPRPSEYDLLITRSRETDPLVVVRPNLRTPEGHAQASEVALEVAAHLTAWCEAQESERDLDDALDAPIDSREGAFDRVPTREGERPNDLTRRPECALEITAARVDGAWFDIAEEVRR